MSEIAVVREKAEKHRRLLPRGAGGPLLVTPMAGWMVGFFLVPLFLIFIYSFGYQPVYETTVQMSFSTDEAKAQYSIQSLHQYRKILTDPVYLKAMVRSGFMVVYNTVLCLFFGYPLAYFISRKAGKRKTLFLLLVMLPFWTSFLIRTYAWITILDTEGLLNDLLGILSLPKLGIMNTQWAVATGLIYDYLPFMVLPLFVSIEKIDKSLFEASKDLGAGKWTTLTKVTLPLSVPGIVAGCMLVAIPTTGEFVIPQLLGGDKVVVWGWLIYKAFGGTGDFALGSAMSNILLAVMLVIIVMYVKLWGTEEF